MSPKLLQAVVDIVVHPLSVIYARSLRLGVVPLDWLKANVTPVYKSKESKSAPGNYRPISLTCILCKVMEAIIRDEIVSHLTDNKLINPSQHGFMSRRSCLTNLLEYLEVLTSLVDAGHSMDVIYLDFAKAFDNPQWQVISVVQRCFRCPSRLGPRTNPLYHLHK